MMKNWVRVAAVSAAIVCFQGLSSAAAPDPKPGTPEAAAEGDRLMRQMSDILAGTSRFRFTTAESLEAPGPAVGRRVVRFTRTVTVRRPDALRFELHGAEGTTLNVVANYAGRTMSLHDLIHGEWAQAEVPGTIDEMLDDIARRYSVPVPIADVVYSVPYEAFIGRTTKGGLVGRESIDGVDCAHLSYSDEFVDVRIWIPSSGQPLPRRVELVYKQAEGAPTARIDFKSWDLKAKFEEGAFAFQPPEAGNKISAEQFTSRMLSGQHSGAPPTPSPEPSGGSKAR